MDTDVFLRFNDIVRSLRDEYDTRILRRLRDITKPHERKVTTSIPELDRLLEIGGLPRGEVIEFSAAPTSGVMSLAWMLVADAQRRHEAVAYIDYGLCFDADFAAGCDVALEKLTIVRPTVASAALSIAATLAGYGNVSVVVIDSAELLHQECDPLTFEHSLRRLQATLHKSRTTALFLSTVSPAGVLPFASAVHLRLDRQRWLRRRGDIAGVQSRVTVERNKFGRSGGGLSLQFWFPEERW